MTWKMRENKILTYVKVIKTLSLLRLFQRIYKEPITMNFINYSFNIAIGD